MTGADLQNTSAKEKHSIGVRLLGERRGAEASAILRAAFEEGQTSELANDWAVAEFSCGRAAEAEQGFKQALTLDTENTKAAMNLGILLAVQSRFQEAIPLLENAVESAGEGEHAVLFELLKRCRVQATAANAPQMGGAVRRLKILSAYDDSFREMGEISETSIRLYSAIQNADFEVRRNVQIGRPPAWAKIRYLIEEIRKGSYEFLLWIDADACFVRGDLDILNCVRPDKELFVVNHRVNKGMLKNFPGVFAYYDRPNTGVILVRSSAWCLEFLERIWAKEEYINHPWWENAAFMDLIGYWQELGQEVRLNEPDQSALSKIGWLPIEWNSVPTQVNGELAGIAQNPVIMHFAGMPNDARTREMKRLIFGPIPLCTSAIRS